jgi:L-ascorbate metabolism protein UlaG (beta-lactamase superfamily)
MRNDTYRGYNGYMIEAGRYRVLFGGDTADTHLFELLKSSRSIDLAIMPIGAYNPWLRNHCNPEQAWRMGNEAGQGTSSPFTTRPSPRRGAVFEPIERFRAAAPAVPRTVSPSMLSAESFTYPERSSS